MKKKILSSLLIGAFVFGLGAADIQPVSAETPAKINLSTPPEPPKDKDGNPMAPHDRNNGDNSNRPEPPKDKDGNPIAPPDKNNGDNSNRPEPPKDANGNPMAPPDKNNGDNSNRPTPPDRNK